MKRTKDRIKMLIFATVVFALVLVGITALYSDNSSAAPDEIKTDSNNNVYSYAALPTSKTVIIQKENHYHTGGNGVTGVFSSSYSLENMFSGADKVMVYDDITAIGDYTFYNCTSLKTVELPSTLKSIGAHAFEGCSNLTSIVIPDSIISIGDSAFDGCLSLSTVSIGSGVQSIGGSVFRGCCNITSLTVDAANSNYCNGIDNDLLSKDGTILISCPSADSYVIPNGVTTVRDYAFECNVNLTDVGIHASTIDLGDCPFKMCYDLQYITVDSGNTAYMDQNGILFNKSGTELILYPSNMSGDSYTIPSTVTIIAEYAFHTCRNLSTVTVPASVMTIKEFALSSYTTPPTISTITFLGSTPATNYCDYGSAILYVPDVAAYRTAWNVYSSYIYQKIAYDSSDTVYDGNSRRILDTEQVTVDSGTNTAINGGDYSVTATPKYSDGYVWDDGSYTARTILWSIKPITIIGLQLELYYSYVDYNGKVHCPVFSHFWFDTDPSTPALKSSDISISLNTGSDGKNVGTHYVTVSTTNSNFTIAPDVWPEQSFDIRAIDLTLKPVSGQSKTYNGTTEYDLDYTYTGNVAGEIPCISGKFSVPNKNVGTRTIGLGTVQLDDNGSFKASNYKLKFSTTAVSMQITKADLIVAADEKIITYGDVAPEYTVSYEGLVGGELPSVLGGSLSFACDYNYYDPENRGAGVYDIIPGGLTSANYDISFVNGILSVNMLVAELSWHLDDYTSDLVYSGFPKGLEAWVDNSLFGDVVDVMVQLTPGKNNIDVGKFTYLAMGIDHVNYTVSTTGLPVASDEFEITAADITGTLVQTGTMTYNGSPQAAAAGGLETVDSVTVVMTYCLEEYGTYGSMPEFTNAGSYTVYYKANAPNHNENTGSLTVTVDKAAPVADNFDITYPSVSDRTYDGDEKEVIVTTKTGIEGMGTFGLLYTGTSGIGDNINAGKVLVELFINEGSNYLSERIVLDPFDIKRAELTPSVHLSGVSSKIYDGTTDISGASITLSGAVNLEEPTASATFALASKNVGTTDVNATDIILDGSWDTNYYLSSTTATGSKGSSLVTVRTVPLTEVSWASYSGAELTYQRADLSSMITAAFSGQGSDGQINLTITFSGTSGAAQGATSFFKAGTYDATGTNTDTNYKFDGTCTNSYEILRKNITSSVKSDISVTKTYDGNTDNTSSIGTYYEFQMIESGDTVTLEAVLAYNSKDVLSADKMNITDLELSGPDAGNYKLMTTSMVINDASITPKTLTVTVNDSKLYDGVVLEHTIVGDDAVGLISGESFSKGKVATIDFAVGTYTEMGTEWEISEALEITGGIDNYDVSFSSVTLQIGLAIITVTPDSGQNKMYSTEDPTLTFTYSGQLPSMTPGFKGALARAPGEGLGTYEINVGTLELADNGEFIASCYILKVSSGVEFTIIPKIIQRTDFNVDLCNEIYTGSEITKTVTSAMKVGTEYNVAYDDNIFVGTAHITITGIGNYDGTVIFDFSIVKRTIAVPEELYYIETGEEITFQLPVSSYYTETSGRPQKGTDTGTYPYEFLLDPNCEWSVSVYDGRYNVYITEESVAEIDENGTVIVYLTGSKGIRSDLILNVKATDDVSEIQKNYGFKDGKARYCYSLTFMKDGTVVQPVGKISVDLLIPKSLRMLSFDIYHIHNGTATKMDKTVNGDYATVETDSFSDFVFVSEFDQKTLVIFGVSLAIITLIALYLICIRKGKGYADDAKTSRSERCAKKKAEKKTGTK